jgi:hypothetical protein
MLPEPLSRDLVDGSLLLELLEHTELPPVRLLRVGERTPPHEKQTGEKTGTEHVTRRRESNSFRVATVMARFRILGRRIAQISCL